MIKQFKVFPNWGLDLLWINYHVDSKYYSPPHENLNLNLLFLKLFTVKFLIVVSDSSCPDNNSICIAVILENPQCSNQKSHYFLYRTAALLFSVKTQCNFCCGCTAASLTCSLDDRSFVYTPIYSFEWLYFKEHFIIVIYVFIWTV